MAARGLYDASHPYVTSEEHFGWGYYLDQFQDRPVECPRIPVLINLRSPGRWLNKRGGRGGQAAYYSRAFQKELNMDNVKLPTLRERLKG